MKFTLATIVAAFAVLSSAQDITQIPVRAVCSSPSPFLFPGIYLANSLASQMKCVADNFGWSGCQSPFDFVCICKAYVFPIFLDLE